MNNDTYLLGLIIFGSVLLVVLVLLFVSIMFLFRQRLIKHRAQMREAEIKREKELLQTKVEVQEQAFKIVSLEAHDNVGQLFSLAKLQITSLLSKELPPGIRSVLKNTADIQGMGIEALRNLAHTLNGRMVHDLGLIRSIEKELSYLRSFNKLECLFARPGEQDLPVLTEEQNLLLFRISQEALQNIIKHARATLVNIDLSYKENTLSLSIADNGAGIGQGKEKNEGMGLRNIRERARMLGAKFNIISIPGKGTKVALQIQIPHNERDKKH